MCYRVYGGHNWCSITHCHLLLYGFSDLFYISDIIVLISFRVVFSPSSLESRQIIIQRLLVKNMCHSIKGNILECQIQQLSVCNTRLFVLNRNMFSLLEACVSYLFCTSAEA